MARPLRIQFPDAHYHVTCRGNARQDIVSSDRDRATFLQLLERSSHSYEVAVLGFVIMRNHFHLLVRTPKANLQEFMRHFNISYTSSFNRTHHRSGHLYQGRYKAFLVDADRYLLEVSRYLHLNPVRTRAQSGWTDEEKRAFLSRYVWSSYPSCIFRTRRYAWISQEILDLFGGDTPRGRTAYRRFVEEGITAEIENPMEKGRGHAIVGDQPFIDKVRRLVTHTP